MGSRSKVLATSLLVAVFVAGGVLGGAISSAWGEGDNADEPRRERSEDSGRRARYGDRLQEELHLTAAQRESIDSILEQYREEIRRLWQEVGPRFDTVRQDIRDQVRGTLNEEQQQRYAELLAEHDRRGHPRNGKGGGGEKRRDK